MYQHVYIRRFIVVSSRPRIIVWLHLNYLPKKYDHKVVPQFVNAFVQLVNISPISLWLIRA